MKRVYVDVLLDAAIISVAATLFTFSVLGTAMYGFAAKFAVGAAIGLCGGYYGWRGFVNGVRKIKAENRRKKAHQTG